MQTRRTIERPEPRPERPMPMVTIQAGYPFVTFSDLSTPLGYPTDTTESNALSLFEPRPTGIGYPTVRTVLSSSSARLSSVQSSR